jgi:hypothetical protein
MRIAGRSATATSAGLSSVSVRPETKGTARHRQPVGGRIDFLMRDTETYYEVEIMLGTLDESHIIRTIEYWDIERQRRPQFDHCAVIVAEHITSRFFNVLRLLNRAVPMIAVQMSAFRLSENEIVIHAVNRSECGRGNRR